MKLALIELDVSHTECLYAQIEFLHDEFKGQIEVFCNVSIQSQLIADPEKTKVHFFKIRKGIFQWIDFYRLAKRLNKYDRVVFNTAQGKKISRILFFISKKVSIYGILHNIRKLENSNSQNYISSRIKKYLVLNDYLIQNPIVKDKNKFASFYPIVFPKVCTGKYEEMEKPENDIWLCVPGSVEFKRRDYMSLFNAIKTHGIASNIKIILLGNSTHKYGNGKEIKAVIEQLNITCNFKLFDGFVDINTFIYFLNKTDFILPLIHQTHPSFHMYKTQISGAYNLAFAYKLPLLMENNFSDNEDFKDASIFYEVANMMHCINSLKKSSTIPFYQQEKWRFDTQKKNYLKGIEVV